MNSIGRITAPIMFYALVEGYHKTKSRKKYFLRLLFFAIISYFPFIYMRSGGNLQNLEFNRLNVIFNILLGFTAVHIRRNVKSNFLQVPLLFFLLIISVYTDWSYSGITIMLIFDYYYGNKNNQLFGYFLWVIFSESILACIANPFQEWLIFGEEFNFPIDFSYIYRFAHLIPMILLSFYNGEKGSNTTFSKYIFYVFYLAHLLLIGMIGSALSN